MYKGGDRVEGYFSVAFFCIMYFVFFAELIKTSKENIRRGKNGYWIKE